MASGNGGARLISGTLQPMLLFVTAVKMLAEIALMLLLGRGLLALLAGPARGSNPVYRLLQWLTDPLLRGTRAMLPGFLLERHLGLAAGAALLLIWLLSTAFKVSYCLRIGVALCQ